MAEKNYSKREIDNMFKVVSDKMDAATNSQANFQKDIRDSNSRLENEVTNGFKGVHDRQDTANGRTTKTETQLAVLKAVFYTTVAILTFIIGSILIPIVGAYVSTGRL